jgi:hypothetical protein
MSLMHKYLIIESIIDDKNDDDSVQRIIETMIFRECGRRKIFLKYSHFFRREEIEH